MPAGDTNTFREGDMPVYYHSGTSTRYTVWTNWAGSATNAFQSLTEATDNTARAAGNLANTSTYWTGSVDAYRYVVHQDGEGGQFVAERIEDPVRITLEQAAQLAQERARQVEEQRREYQEHARQRAMAQNRAHNLLLENLTTEQAEEYLRDQAFHIMAANGKRYRITKGYVSNLSEVDDAGKIVNKYCVHIKAGIEQPPDEDNLLAQVLFLRTDPQALLSKANVLH